MLPLLLLSCARSSEPVRFVAHRGVHQTFPPEGITNTTCTAQHIRPPTHGLIENTLPSIEAALALGAEAVEVDVHATADGHLVVFHDATLDCRTDGTGRPEDHALADLRGLDLGHGYTADGVTYPLRGTGVGLLVTLPEVLTAFPDARFVIDIKSGSPADGDRVAAVLSALSPEDRGQQIVYGGAAAERVEALLPEVTTITRGALKDCLKGYLATGWLGRVPASCHDTWIVLPRNYTWLLWGFPRRLEARMAAVGSEVVIAGPIVDGISTGIDHPEQLADIPRGFGGLIWTNRIEVLAGEE